MLHLEVHVVSISGVFGARESGEKAEAGQSMGSGCYIDWSITSGGNADIYSLSLK